MTPRRCTRCRSDSPRRCCRRRGRRPSSIAPERCPLVLSASTSAVRQSGGGRQGTGRPDLRRVSRSRALSRTLRMHSVAEKDADRSDRDRVGPEHGGPAWTASGRSRSSTPGIASARAGDRGERAASGRICSNLPSQRHDIDRSRRLQPGRRLPPRPRGTTDEENDVCTRIHGRQSGCPAADRERVGRHDVGETGR